MFKKTIIICLVTYIILVLDLTVVVTEEKEEEAMEDYYEENNYVVHPDSSEEDDVDEVQQEVEDGTYTISKVNMIRCSRRFTPGVCQVRVQPVWTFDVMMQGCNMRMGCSQEVGRENRFSDKTRCHKACLYLQRLYNHALLQESNHSHMENEDESTHSHNNEDGPFDSAKPSLREKAPLKNRGTDIDIYYDLHSTEETEEEIENERSEPYADDDVFEEEDLQQNYDTSNVESDLIEVEHDKTFLDDDIQ